MATRHHRGMSLTIPQRDIWYTRLCVEPWMFHPRLETSVRHHPYRRLPFITRCSRRNIDTTPQSGGIRARREVAVGGGIAKSQRAALLYAFPESILTRPYVELDRHQFPYVSNQDWRRILPQAGGDVLCLRSINPLSSDSTHSRRGGSRVNYCEIGVAYALPIPAG